MSAVDVVKDLMSGLETGDFNKVSSVLADDFKFDLPAAFPIGKMEILGFMGVFKNAFPDWVYNFTDGKEEGDFVKGTVQPGGHNTNDVNLPGMPPLKATGKFISLPPFSVEFTVKNNQVSGLKLNEVPGGTFSNLMQNLGLKIPGMN
jgi:hypothetical protein